MTPLTEREKINRRAMAIEAPTPQVFSIEQRTTAHGERPTPLRLYFPNAQPNLPFILLIHGGAWVAGNLETHDNLARYLCSQVEAIVVAVDYVNAPEGKFPLQLHQCHDAVTWIMDHAHEFSADASKLAVVGDSAGANMAAALCLMERDQHGPTINLQVLINPALDLSCKGTLEQQHDALDLLRWQASQYLRSADESRHPYASPLLANDLGHLPKAVILLAEKDDLREDGQKYAERLQASGVETIVYCQQGIGHLAGHGARASLQARESLDVAVRALKEALRK